MNKKHSKKQLNQWRWKLFREGNLPWPKRSKPVIWIVSSFIPLMALGTQLAAFLIPWAYENSRRKERRKREGTFLLQMIQYYDDKMTPYKIDQFKTIQQTLNFIHHCNNNNYNLEYSSIEKNEFNNNNINNNLNNNIKKSENHLFFQHELEQKSFQFLMSPRIWSQHVTWHSVGFSSSKTIPIWDEADEPEMIDIDRWPKRFEMNYRKKINQRALETTAEVEASMQRLEAIVHENKQLQRQIKNQQSSIKS